ALGPPPSPRRTADRARRPRQAVLRALLRRLWAPGSRRRPRRTPPPGPLARTGRGRHRGSARRRGCPLGAIAACRGRGIPPSRRRAPVARAAGPGPDADERLEPHPAPGAGERRPADSVGPGRRRRALAAVPRDHAAAGVPDPAQLPGCLRAGARPALLGTPGRLGADLPRGRGRGRGLAVGRPRRPGAPPRRPRRADGVALVGARADVAGRGAAAADPTAGRLPVGDVAGPAAELAADSRRAARPTWWGTLGRGIVA